MLADLQGVFPQPSAVYILAGSTVMTEGHVVVEGLDVDGTARPLVRRCRTTFGERRHYRALRWGVRSTDTAEAYLIRRYVLEKDGLETVRYTRR